MKHKRIEICRFCNKPIVKGEFRDTHSDGNFVCLTCYNQHNSTPENKKQYNASYHYSIQGVRPWSRTPKTGKA